MGYLDNAGLTRVWDRVKAAYQAYTDSAVQAADTAVRAYVDEQIKRAREKIVTLSGAVNASVKVSPRPWGDGDEYTYQLQYTGRLESGASTLILSPPRKYTFSALNESYIPVINVNGGTRITGSLNSDGAFTFAIPSTARGKTFSFTTWDFLGFSWLCIEVA